MEIQVTFESRPSSKVSLIVKKTVYEGKSGVLKVFSPLHQSNFALKVFPKDTLGACQYQKEKLMFKLKHPNVIKRISAVCHLEKHFAFLAEYASFGDFFDVVTKGLLTHEILVRTYFHQLIEGIEYIHSEGVAHLDLKLENIMLSDDLQLKIIDFDQAQATTDKRITSGGTMSYRAPEVMNGTCSNMTVADIYSAGVILFCFKAKEFPFSEKEDPTCKDIKCYTTFHNNNQRFWQGKAETKKDRAFFSEDFIELVNGMLNKDPSKRLKIKEIKASRWYNGPVLDQDGLKHEMKTKFMALNRAARKNTQQQ